MKYVLILLGFIANVGLIVGQSNIDRAQRDTLELRNGVILFGNIESITEEGTLCFSSEGYTYYFHERKIKNIYNGNELTYKKNTRSINERLWFLQFFNAIHFGADGSGASSQLKLEYLFNHHAVVFAGIGVDNYNFTRMRNLYALSVGYKSYLFDRKNTPFISFATGYGFAFKNIDNGVIEANGGLLFNPALGLRFGTGDLIITTQLGLKFQNAQYTYSGWRGDFIYEDRRYQRVELGIGLIF